MDISVAGRRVLITAAGSGIGRVAARTLIAEGARVHISDMTDDALAEARHNSTLAPCPATVVIWAITPPTY